MNWLVLALMGFAAAAPAARADDFPYGRELLLDTAPMRGSKRIPGIEIDRDGTATLDLWCNSVPARLVVAGDTITIIAGPVPARSCPPERARGDEELLAALTDVTHWRRQGEFLIFSGARTLRYRFQTN
jgi:heat shock protein HslJ